MNTLIALIHGFLLRCPYCGEGKLFRKWFSMYERCPVCGFRFEREEGYWTGAMAVNMMVTVLFIVFVLVPLAIVFAAAHESFILFLLVSLPLPLILPLLLFRHAKSLWLNIDFMINPAEPDERR